MILFTNMFAPISLFICVLQLSRQVCGSYPAFEPSLYEDALDPEICEKQLEYLKNNTLLRLQFMDAGARIPRGFLNGNQVDLGYYYQCLGLTHPFEGSVIQGKFCMVKGTLSEDLMTNITSVMFSRLNHVSLSDTHLNGSQFRVTVCVPKTCTSNRGFQGLVTGMDIDVGLKFEEEYCRLPNDKPWAPVDTVTIGILLLFGLLTTMSTFYDLYNTKVLGKDPNELNTVYRSFSFYTNTRVLLTFNSRPGSLDCLEGIRTLAMSWVILGHCFTTQPFWLNTEYTFKFMEDWTSLWLTAAPLTVDTFFMLSGLLCVYTATRKLSESKLKNIWVLCLDFFSRFFRLFPILAAGILLEASIAHRVSDGPFWQNVAKQADSCRNMWWATLLNIQNYAALGSLCIGQSWYLAIDMQLHCFSPIVLLRVVGRNRRVAWITLASATLVSLTSATIYNFVNNFPSTLILTGRRHELMRYITHYYVNTLTRAPPFFVGMLFGYILHSWRGKEIVISKLKIKIMWISTFILFSMALYTTYLPTQSYWNNQTIDNLINSFQRAGWALGLGLLILACVHGYGGPINWLLSLQLWRLPSKISYAMFILHASLMSIVNGSRLEPVYFSFGTIIYNFLSFYTMAFIAAFIVTIVIDSPCALFFKYVQDKVIPQNPSRTN